MGLSTVAIGLLPTYAAIGIAAPALLALCRFGQGLGLGGEWGGAVLLATENAPRGKESWYGMFPQLGAPLGFICSTGIFIVLTGDLERRRVPRVGLAHPVPRERGARRRRAVGAAYAHRDAGVPARDRARRSACACRSSSSARSTPRTLVLATLAAVTTFVVFYLMTVFTLSWGTTAARLHPPGVLAAADDRRAVLRADDSADGSGRGSRRPLAGADRLERRRDRVRPHVRAAVLERATP